ncbi:MAG: hypothetical protein V4511_15305 [Bacteroidota bacterium]
MKQYNQFVKFIGNNYSCFIFIALFYSLWLVYKYASTFNPELQSFPGRMIGSATLEAYDISKRIRVFYGAGALFLLSIVFIPFFAWRISGFLKDIFKTSEVKIINYTSLAGITLIFFSVWDSSVNTSLALVFCIHLVTIVVLICKKLFLKSIANTEVINVSFYAVAFVCGFSVFFLWNEIAVLFSFLPNANLTFSLFTTVIILFGITTQLIKNKNLYESRNEINKLAFILASLALIPLLSVFKDETYLILNKHQLYYFSPRKLYLIGLICISASIVWRYRIVNKKLFLPVTNNIEHLISKRYFPLLILGISLFTFYTPFIQSSSEMFEAGNRVLPLMEFQKFGVIPIIEKYNSHGLSELFFKIIYVFFNGLNGREMFIYDFLYQGLWAFLVYFFLYKLFRNAYIALFFVLLFPLIEPLISDYQVTALIGVFILHKIIEQKSSFKNYILLFLCASFLLIWRLDIGYPATIAIAGTLFFYRINRKGFVFNKQLLLKSTLAFFAFAFLLLLIIAWYRNINIIYCLINSLNYLSSAQSYCSVGLGDFTLPAVKMQYFIFPLLLIFGFCAFWVSFERNTISRSQRFVHTTIIFLTIYYFVSFQRGIVSHTLVGGADFFLSPFLFLIISAGFYLFFYKKSTTTKFILFIVASSFLILNYKHPAVNAPQNIYSAIINKTSNFPKIEPKENIIRCIDDMQYEQLKFSNFKKLITKQLTDKQTFIDFSNTPMLYYFTGKISPSSFYQNPLTIHNDYLQKNFISDLKNYDAPLIIFSNFPENWWDNAVGVPNIIRHYRMAEYFYTHFEPFVIVDNLCIWKRKGFQIKNNQRLIYNYSAQAADSLKINLPIKGYIKKSENKNYLFKINSNSFKDKTGTTPEFNIILANGAQNLKPDFVDEINQIGYYLFSTHESVFSFQIKNEGKNINVIKVYESDYIPDFYSLEPKRCNINQLPYIWGTYDKNVHQEKVITNLLSQPQTISNNTIEYFSIPTDIDKSTGNTLLISMECNNEAPATMELMYGNDKKEYRGTFVFSIPPGKGKHDFAIRISSQYNWFASDNDYIALNCKDIESVKLDSIKLLKGN